MLRLTLAVLHLLALGLGLHAVISRGLALREAPTDASLRRVFRDDAFWGIAAGIWISTGLWRMLASTEKASSYYYTNHVFYAKMGFLLLILALEIMPIITLGRWRAALGKGRPASEVAVPATAQRIATFSFVQAVLTICMVTAAVLMARGYGAR